MHVLADIPNACTQVESPVIDCDYVHFIPEQVTKMLDAGT